MTQAYESLGNPGLIRKWGSGGSGTRSETIQEHQFDTTASFSASKWRKKYIRTLVISDLVLIVLVCGAVLWLFTNLSRTNVSFAAASVFVWATFLELARTRAPQQIGVGAKEYKRVVDSTAFAAGTMALLALFLDLDGVREQILIVFPLGALLLLVGRWRWRRWLRVKSKAGYALSQVVVVGQRPDIDYVVRQLQKNAGPAYKISGVLVDEAAEELPFENRMPTFFGLVNLERSVDIVGADSVIVAGPLAGGSEALKDLSWRLEKTRTNVIVVSSLTNVAGPRISMRPVEGLPLMHVDVPSFAGGHHVIKRILDILLSSFALMALAPVFLVIALAVRRDSAGPVFFSQERVGRGGKRFRMYKFRSMVVNAEEELEKLKSLNEGSGPLFKMKQDPRVTKIGSWLRKYSLDELPQIFNALTGDMSLVGPRPPLPLEVEAYKGHTGRRLFIKPGLTGLWQINGRSDLDWEESIRLDLYYVENWSLTGDLMIMWRTFKAMVQPSGAY